MDLLKKCYLEFTDSPEFHANDGWHKRMWELEEMAIEHSNFTHDEYVAFEDGISGELCELEARYFAAGFHAGLAVAVQKVMEAGRCSLT